MGITHICDGQGNITARVAGQVYNVPADHKLYDQVKTALREGNVERFSELANLGKGVASFISNGNNGEELVKVVDGVVFYKGQSVHNVVTERILQFMEKGHDYQPLVRFLERLLLNPSRHSVNQLYRFLENHNLPLTEDGCFLAYKRVNDDWRDYHTGKIDNSVGANPKMDRREVDDDFSKDCSYGLHVGAINYVRGFHTGCGHVVAVKVDPQNAVAVPDYDCTKMRVCEYLVMEEIPDPETCALSEDLYKTEGVSYSPVTPAVPSASVASESSQFEDDDDEGEDDDWYEDDYDEEDYEDDEDDCDEEDYEDDEDDEDDCDEDEDDSNFEMVRDWAETIGIPSDYVESPDVRSLISDGDSEGLIQLLYARCIEGGDTKATQNLEKKIYRGRLKDILSDN